MQLAGLCYLRKEVGGHREGRSQEAILYVYGMDNLQVKE
jgi:hypothetical protein